LPLKKRIFFEMENKKLSFEKLPYIFAAETLGVTLSIFLSLALQSPFSLGLFLLLTTAVASNFSSQKGAILIAFLNSILIIPLSLFYFYLEKQILPPSHWLASLPLFFPLFFFEAIAIARYQEIKNNLEFKVKERTQELEEMKKNLELKVKQRTKELEELTQTLEKKVRERTRELQAKVEELEKFQKLAVGREMKMVELKRKIKELEEKLKNKSL